jgi:outer membrane scaffolding protein for murein synthesis (MipA/OmpV family)
MKASGVNYLDDNWSETYEFGYRRGRAAQSGEPIHADDDLINAVAGVLSNHVLDPKWAYSGAYLVGWVITHVLSDEESKEKLEAMGREMLNEKNKKG